MTTTTLKTTIRSVRIGEICTTSGMRHVATVVTDHGTYGTKPGQRSGSMFHEGMRDIPVTLTLCVDGQNILFAE